MYIFKFNLSNIKYLGLPLIFLDAYSIYRIPVNWIGFILIFISYFLSNNVIKYMRFVLLLLFISLIFEISNINFFELSYLNLQYLSLRNFNLISGIVIFKILIEEEFSLHKKFLEFQKYVLYFLVFTTLYIYFAQIFDFFEPLRNRSNTSVYSGSAQTTFWPNNSHRALGTFREPSYLATYLFPICLLIFKYNKKISKFLILIAALSIGLTKSDFIEVICVVIIFLELSNLILKKQFNNQNILFFIVAIFLFSQINIYECRVNPESIDCKEYYQNLNKKIQTKGVIDINKQGIEKNVIFDFDTERFQILKYSIEMLKINNNSGYLGINPSFQYYLYKDTNLEMYLTNRTLPNYLLDNYPTQNFGTGRYSLLRFPINIQNKIAFYFLSFGYIFLIFLILFIFIFFINIKLNNDSIFFIAILLFLVINPIEEFNAFFGLILGYTYQLTYKVKTNENL